MIINLINEFTVWIDSLEDEGIDVSLLRLLCSYNYFPYLMVFPSENNYRYYAGVFLGDGGDLAISPMLHSEFVGMGNSYWEYENSRLSGNGITLYENI